MLAYSLEVGNVTSSTLISKLQEYVYNTLPLLTMDVLGSELPVVVECSIAVDDLAAPLCPQPESPAHVYNDPLVFGFSLIAAIIVGFLCGALSVAIITSTCHVYKK